MTAKYAAMPLVLAAMLTLVSLGCQRANATDEAHLEHHTPPHKPQNLTSAIDQIERRFESLAHRHGSEIADNSAQLKELVDIVRWLPEIAGDSDLPEQQWNEVDHISERLCPLLQDQLSNAESRREVSLLALHDLMFAELKKLRAVLGVSPIRAATVAEQEHRHDHD